MISFYVILNILKSSYQICHSLWGGQGFQGMMILLPTPHLASPSNQTHFAMVFLFVSLCCDSRKPHPTSNRSQTRELTSIPKNWSIYMFFCFHCSGQRGHPCCCSQCYKASRHGDTVTHGKIYFRSWIHKKVDQKFPGGRESVRGETDQRSAGDGKNT